MNKIIYISGKITGFNNWQERFIKSEKKLKEKFPGCIVINPLRISKKVEERISEPEYKDYMEICIFELLYADTVFFQRNWIFSKGARLEHHIAKLTGKVILYE